MLTRHIKGSCFGDCHRLDDHRACDDEKLEELLSWCKHNEEGVPQSGINPNYMGEVFSPYKNGLKGALGKKENRERVPYVYGTGKLCVYYFIYGFCSYPICSFSHADLDQSKKRELVQWCQEVMPDLTK